MATIIPHLVGSLHKRKVDPIKSVSELLLSFVAAYKDVPFQRRQDLFASLGNLVGADDFLYALLVMLLDKYPGQESVVDFAAKLAAQHDCKIQLLVSLVLKRSSWSVADREKMLDCGEIL